MKLGGMQVKELSASSVVFIIVLALAGMTWFLRDISTAKRYTHYTASVYKPNKTEFCPGETLIFTPTLVIEQAPVVLELTTTFFEDDPPHSVGPRDLESSVARSTQLTNGSRTNAIRITVPQLPPQPDYRVIRALEKAHGDSIMDYTTVPFAIRSDC